MFFSSLNVEIDKNFAFNILAIIEHNIKLFILKHLPLTWSIFTLNIDLTYTEIQTGSLCYGSVTLFSYRSSGPGKFSGQFHVLHIS